MAAARLCLLLLLGITFVSARTVVSSNGFHHVWRAHEEAHEDTPLTFTIFLKHRNLDVLESLFWNVSTPGHADYGQHKSRAYVEDLTSPSSDSFAAIERWLLKEFSGELLMEKGTAFIRVTDKVSAISSAVGAKIHKWLHPIEKKVIHRAFGKVSVPTSIHKHIDTITGLYDFHLGDSKVSSKASPLASSRVYTAESYQSSFSNLRSRYQIPKTPTTSSYTTQGVIAFSEYYQVEPLELALTRESVPFRSVINVGQYGCASCGYQESNLDMQTMMVLSPQTTTYHIGADLSYSYILEMLEIALPKSPTTPQVLSISYGGSESPCPSSGSNTFSLCNKNSADYRNRVDVELQKLGVMGVSVIVASGDTGPLAGNVPVCLPDYSYCPYGGCTYTASKCQQVLLRQSVPWPGFGLDPPQSVINQFLSNNAACNLALDGTAAHPNSILHSTCDCASLNYGTFAGGWTFSAYDYTSPDFGDLFFASYPATSAYVTSVGATVLTSSSETTAALDTGASISTGGGFSLYVPRPSYQDSAVNGWLSNGPSKPAASSYNSSNRAIPDISLSGHNYIIVSSSAGSCSNNQCFLSSVDGTSASAPAFGSMISMINDVLINSGKTTAGFLNPLLYQAAREKPSVYNDITTGGNRCSGVLCCANGYYATQGWDPSTGLGSINYPALRDYVVNALSNSTFNPALYSNFKPQQTNTFTANGATTVTLQTYTVQNVVGTNGPSSPASLISSMQMFCIVMFSLIMLL
ncbi:peptidase S8 and S53 domain-containing protein [Planoprotostelium fungivorum]|uniref:Peptidase S8 and S53 domain-containing protein n=1 Tax=Planoprotostelium fungivorum TaxID=1890364 RepID=A0A2P6MSD9_9EUKA|nr:peptidase S8 and S53 domain-containing protein [Planoprotostelium fungivorum]